MVEKLVLVGPPEPGSIKRHVIEFHYDRVVEVSASFGWGEHWRFDTVTPSGGVVCSALFYQPRRIDPIDDYPQSPMLIMAVRPPIVVPPEFLLIKILLRFGAFGVEASALLDLEEVEVPR